MIPPMPPFVFSAWLAILLLLFIGRWPPKGPSAQEVHTQLELPLEMPTPKDPRRASNEEMWSRPNLPPVILSQVTT